MTTASPPPSVHLTAANPLLSRIRPISVDEYHQMIQAGILRSGEKVELLDGILVTKMTVNPPHMFSLQAVSQLLAGLIPGGWELRVQGPITLATSEPEPDVAVARGDRRTYALRHPGPADLALVVEIADSSLTIDQTVKGPLHGAARIPVYWIVDIVNRQVEVYTLTPTGYGPPLILVPGQMLPLVLDGFHLGDLPVAELFV